MYISDEFRTVISDVLALGAANQVYEGYKTDNIDNVTVKIDIGGEVTEYTKDDFKAENGVYIVVLDRLTSKQYDEAITATLYEGDIQVGGTG